jgi:transposase-like protein
MGVHGAVTFFLPPGIKRLTIRDIRPRKRKMVANRDLLNVKDSKEVTPALAPPQEPEESCQSAASSKTPFPDCADFSDRGGCQTVLHQRYEGNRGDILRCKTCGRTFSSRRGDITFKSRLADEVMDQLVEYYNRGESIRRVSKVLNLNRGTVRRYYRLLDERGSIR